jgi:hypothetical protein
MGVFIDSFRRGMEIGSGSDLIHPLLALHRDAACKGLAHIIAQMTPEQFEEFERGFIEICLGMVGAAHRQRAMELYAFIKIEEIAQFGQRTVFLSDGSPVL